MSISPAVANERHDTVSARSELASPAVANERHDKW